MAIGCTSFAIRLSPDCRITASDCRSRHLAIPATADQHRGMKYVGTYHVRCIMLRLEYAGGLHARWRLKYAGFMMQKHIVRLFDFMRYVYMPARTSVSCSFGALGIMAPKSDAGRSAGSRKHRKHASKLTDKAVGQAQETPTVAPDAEEPSLATVCLCISYIACIDSLTYLCG
jgi:hypothetical protein